MDLPPEVLSLAGAIALAIPLTARVVPKAITTITNAMASRTKARADAELKLAEAKKLEADAEKAEADAALARAATDKIQAESAASTLVDMQRRLDIADQRHLECESRNEARDVEIAHLRNQVEADAELISKFSERAMQDERRMKQMNEEMVELRQIMRAGGLNA